MSSPAITTAGLPDAHDPRARAWWALAVLATGTFVTVLDIFIVNVALGSIQASLHATDAQVQLVVVGYTAAYGLVLMNGARLGDRYGRRGIFLAAHASRVQ